MKNNSGITIITLVITIIVIILIASITIYTGLDTVDSVRTKNANDATNAIYLALIANEDVIPSRLGDGKMISELDQILDRRLINEDFELMDLDYTTENCDVSFDKATTVSGDVNVITYTFDYTDNLNNKYEDLVYTHYKEIKKTNIRVEFDEDKKVNRPVLESWMKPIYANSEEVKNVYTESWYSYNKDASKLAVVTDGAHSYAWIPRFAYKIQDFYIEKSYDNIPSTALDIVFLREDSDYMSNNEVLQRGYTVHPAFENGVTGFWIMTDIENTTNSVANAISATSNITNSSGDTISHLMKNSEYAATVYLLRWLGNSEVNFSEQEFVAAICDGSLENFDIYSSDYSEVNYIRSIRGQALLDTPWDLKAEPILPDSSSKYLLRDVENGGFFYYESTGGITSAAYRTVITK